MKIGLVATPNINAAYYTLGSPGVPLGILCLAAVLEPAGYDITIIDPNMLIAEGKIQVRKGFEKDIAAHIAEQKLDFAGFSTITNTYHHTLRIASALRALDPEIPIVFGGPQATHTDVKTLEAFSEVDVIVRGEGERVILDLLMTIEKNLPLNNILGITYRDGKKIIRNEDAPLIDNINDLPFPAYHLYPVSDKEGVFLDAGRGCPYQCSFCSTCVFWKRHFRQKDPARIAEEMYILKKGYGVRSVDFTHDLFTLNRERVRELCRILKKRKINLPWTCSTRIDCVDKELLRLMNGAGCRKIFYGIESGSKRIQETMGKKIDLATVKDNVNHTVESGIKTVLSFIIGFPEETEEDIKKTVDIAIDLLGNSHLVENSQIHLLVVTNDTKLWHKYRTKLKYDGIETDQVSGNLFFEKEPMIRQYPELFSGHYYLPITSIDRKFLIDLHIMGLLAGSFLRWSIVAASRKVGAFNLAKRWHEYSREDAWQDTTMEVFARRMASLAEYVKLDPEKLGFIDGVFDTLIRYEFDLMNLKTALMTDPLRKKTLKRGDVLEQKEYKYDPAAIISHLTAKRKKPLRKAKTKVEYLYMGWIPTGPVISMRTVKPEKKRKKEAK
jgi:radical SAM superfamily enzyme YgiQ (UPF0313 family)